MFFQGISINLHETNKGPNLNVSSNLTHFFVDFY